MRLIRSLCVFATCLGLERSNRCRVAAICASHRLCSSSTVGLPASPATGQPLPLLPSSRNSCVTSATVKHTWCAVDPNSSHLPHTVVAPAAESPGQASWWCWPKPKRRLDYTTAESNDKLVSYMKQQPCSILYLSGKALACAWMLFLILQATDAPGTSYSQRHMTH